MTRLRVLICGAGVAGNGLAFWLTKLGHDVTVIERSPELRTAGLQLDLRSQAIDVIKRMGLEDVIRAKCVPERGMQLVDTHDRRWGFLPANTSGEGKQTMTSEYEIMRVDLCQALYAGARDRVKYIFGTSVSKFIDDENGAVKVQFDSGIAGTFDFVVGADGLNSRTRRMMLGPDTPDALHHLGEHIAYFQVPNGMQEEEDYTATAYFATSGRFVLTRRHNAHQLQVYLTASNMGARLQGVQRGDTGAEKRAFIAEFSGMGWKVDELLQLMQESDDFYCQREGFVKLDTWNCGLVVLVGDAGFCCSVNGFGTSSALIGAYILAGELARHVIHDTISDSQEGQAVVDKDVQTALGEYERKLRPLITKLQKGLGEPNWLGGMEMKVWHLRLLYWIVWVASTLKVYKLIDLVPDQGAGWDLPEYPELMSQM
ncbi:Monooxygenase, FAD-binding protein [Akanthomyces lecanii RCEF 1005]|uniref:Monooxygenase, FAD-binding protein n=1 Tax=Akanthomyces lecanii RCEF 1005 TaxID=1081108 RepID=A0A167S4X6_CORDF|nr:Monooxygenase, FAD-binding protein [Akanthomyces lecanii RCEF 1005]